MSLPSQDQKFRQACEQMHVANQEDQKDNQGIRLCNCLAVRFGEKLKRDEFQVATKVYETLAHGDELYVDTNMGKLETENPIAMDKIMDTFMSCRPHYGPAPDP